MINEKMKGGKWWTYGDMVIRLYYDMIYGDMVIY